MTLTKTLPRAWKAFTANKRYLILAMLFEFIFLFVLVQISFTFFEPSAQAVQKAGEIMSQEVEKLPEAELYQLDSILMENQEFMLEYKTLITSILFFLISTFVAWIIFKAPVWYFSHKSIMPKMPFGTHALKFCLMSLFWFFVTVASFIIYSITTGSTATIIPIISSTGASTVMWIVLLAVYYFSQISFALVPAQQTFKKTFDYGTKHVKTILPAFIVNALITFIVLTLPYNWAETIPLLTLAIILFVTIPALAFARIHMIVATWMKHD